MLNYGILFYDGHTGPEAFAVEDGTMFILDNHNKRVILWEDRGFSDFDISDCPYAQHMTYQKGKIAVIDPVTMVTGIYSVDGTRLALIQYADHYAFDLQFPVEVTEIGDTYLVWKSSEGVVYLMECLQDGIVISEVKLEPTEVAKGIQ